MHSNLPSVAVLLASYNGAEWIQSQIETILASRDVSVHIFLSDDGSSDNTIDISRNTGGAALTVLPLKKQGSAGANFYRILLDAPWDNYDFVSLADQDDLWLEDKLSRAVATITQQSLSAYSSNVTAFWPNGRKRLIEKSQPQTDFDYLFEGAGPGNTFVFPVEQAAFLRSRLQGIDPEILNRIDPHDWLFYALTRAAGKSWFIDPFSSLQYRQHGTNVMGAAKGFVAIKQRVHMIRSDWYKNQILDIATASGVSNQIIDYLKYPTIPGLLTSLRKSFSCRRKRSEAFALSIFLIWGYFSKGITNR